MAISFVAAGTVFTALTSGTGFTFNKPSGVQDGDLLVGFVATDQDGTMTAPTGWTQNGEVSVDSAADDVHIGVFLRDGLASDPSTWTDGSVSAAAVRRYAIVLAYRGTDVAANQWLASDVSSDTADTPLTTTTATVNNTDDRAWRIECFATHDNALNIGTPNWSDYNPADTERDDTNLGTSDPVLTVAVADSNGPISTGNTSVTATWNTDGSGTTRDTTASWIGLIKPPPPQVGSSTLVYRQAINRAFNW